MLTERVSSEEGRGLSPLSRRDVVTEGMMDKESGEIEEGVGKKLRVSKMASVKMAVSDGDTGKRREEGVGKKLRVSKMAAVSDGDTGKRREEGAGDGMITEGVSTALVGVPVGVVWIALVGMSVGVVWTALVGVPVGVVWMTLGVNMLAPRVSSDVDIGIRTSTEL